MSANDPRIVDILRIVGLLSENTTGGSFDGPGLDEVLGALCFQLLPGSDYSQTEVVAIFAAILQQVRSESISLMHLEALKQEREHRSMRAEWARDDAEREQAMVTS